MSNQSEKAKLEGKDLSRQTEIVTIKSPRIKPVGSTPFKVRSFKIPIRTSSKTLERSKLPTTSRIKATSIDVDTHVLNTTVDSNSELSERQNRQTGGATFSHEANMKSFRILCILALIVGIIMIVFMACWLCFYLDGLKEFGFNWHPFLMTFGFIFLYGNAILVFRVFRGARKRKLKLAHALLHLFVLITAIIALVPAFLKAEAHLYSLHSWIGFFALILFVFQYVLGFLALGLSILKDFYRAAYMPLHMFFGSFTFVLGLVAALTGITLKIIHALGENYKNLAPLAMLGNFCGLTIVIFGALVLFITSFPWYKRRPHSLKYFANVLNQILEDKLD